MISPERMIDELNGVFGSHPGCRALHAKGILCRATFAATPEARGLTRAPHFSGDRLDATVRFSNGGGNPKVPDKERDVRGLAVKIYLPDGSRTDLVSQTIERPPTRTPDEFIELLHLSERKPVNAVKLPLHLLRHPGLVRKLRPTLAGTVAPASFATSRYYAMHAFKWLDADGGSRYVRYTWIPEAGTEKVSGKQSSDFLREELRGRLASGPIRFALEVQIAGPGDDPDDASQAWDPNGRRSVVGHLEVIGLDEDRESGDDVLVFDPCRIPDGIELTADPVLSFRSHAYSESVKRRSGRDRPADYPYG